jgi:disulfide bond formation protein DsbB
MTHDVIVGLAVLGVAGQIVIAALLLTGLLAVAGLPGPLFALQRLARGGEVWLAFVVAAVATGGSLVISEMGGYQPCELCWFERVCVFAVSILLLLFAWKREVWRVRYLVPFPLAGIGVSIYHLLIENGVIKKSAFCASNPAGVVHGTRCHLKWFNEFGYVSITTLALTAFLLLLGFLALTLRTRPDEAQTAAIAPY